MTNKKQIEKMKKEAEAYHTLLLKLCGIKIKDKIDRLIEIELLLKSECNQ